MYTSHAFARKQRTRTHTSGLFDLSDCLALPRHLGVTIARLLDPLLRNVLVLVGTGSPTWSGPSLATGHAAAPRARTMSIVYLLELLASAASGPTLTHASPAPSSALLMVPRIASPAP